MAMKKKLSAGSVHESQATYSAARWMKARRPVCDVIKRMGDFRKRHAHDKTNGKSVVELVREERNR
jgi:hypothetical protein